MRGVERRHRPRRPARLRRAARGTTAVELLLALPIVVLLGLGVVQFCLVYQARHALEHALVTAARHGALAHASGDAILDGLAAGLVPYLYGAEDFAGLVAAEARAREHVQVGLAAGWIAVRQRSPTRESFEDWAEPARDERGELLSGVIEIPNDNLDSRRLRMQPVSGAAGGHLGEPIGRLSGQSLADANLLRLELAYGVRLAVPVVGRVVLRTLGWWHGCRGEVTGPGQGAGMTAPGTDRLGLLRLPLPGAPSGTAHWGCPFYEAEDPQGAGVGRLPLVAAATVRMMSTARRSALTVPRSGEVASGSSGGPADVASSAGQDGPPGGAGRKTDPASNRQPGRESPRQRTPGDDEAGAATSTFANGFLRIGSDRAYPVPTPHPALCNG